MAKDEEKEEAPLQQITTGDPNAVKQLLDDFSEKVVLDQGYNKNNKLMYIKLVFMVAACFVACVAQFWDKIDKRWEFPANRYLLMICCSLYFVFSGILQYILSFIEQDIILITNPKEGLEGSSGLKLRTEFPRFSEFFRITFEAVAAPENSHTFEKSVGQFFDFDGFFDEEAFSGVVKKELEDFENKLGENPKKKS